MKSYLDLLHHILLYGEDREDRTGVGTRSVFGYQWRHRMSDGFPLLTTKKVHWKSIAHELIWFLRGDTNVRYLQENGVTIWDEWADESGELGPVYGKQWRNWVGSNDYSKHWGAEHASRLVHVDQITRLIHDIRTNPFSRRHIVTAWNPAEVLDMALPPCHTLWQCCVSADGKELSLHLYARSIDSFLGLPFNIASYALLLEILCALTQKKARDLIISFGDLHIYHNHLNQVEEQLSRTPEARPRVRFLRSFSGVDSLRYEDIELTGYHPQPAIKAPVAI